VTVPQTVAIAGLPLISRGLLGGLLRFWDDICSRAMTQVDATIAEGSGLAFTQACSYPDGARVFCLAMVSSRAARSRIKTVVQAWDD
jgi:hypothetical protein